MSPMTTATPTRAVCANDAMQLHDLVAAAMSYDPARCPQPWERAGRQAVRVASTMLGRCEWLHEHEVEAMGALLLSNAPGVPLDVTVERIARAKRLLSFRGSREAGDTERRRLLQQFIDTYHGALRREGNAR